MMLRCGNEVKGHNPPPALQKTGSRGWAGFFVSGASAGSPAVASATPARREI
jgi:hypothetical protein